MHGRLLGYYLNPCHPGSSQEVGPDLRSRMMMRHLGAELAGETEFEPGL